MSELHVVFGTGPAGAWIARALADKGLPVRVINRWGAAGVRTARGRGRRRGRRVVPKQAIEAARGASVVYQALNPPYHLWHELFPGLQAGAVAAAQAAGARYVSLENLYMYGHVMARSATAETAPVARKGELRARMTAELQELHRRGELQVAQTRASDYYGPGVTASALGARTFEPLLAGKAAELGRERRRGAQLRLHRGRRRAAGQRGHEQPAFGEVVDRSARTGAHWPPDAGTGVRGRRAPTEGEDSRRHDTSCGRALHARRSRDGRDDVRVHRAYGGRQQYFRARFRLVRHFARGWHAADRPVVQADVPSSATPLAYTSANTHCATTAPPSRR